MTDPTIGPWRVVGFAKQTSCHKAHGDANSIVTLVTLGWLSLGAGLALLAADAMDLMGASINSTW